MQCNVVYVHEEKKEREREPHPSAPSISQPLESPHQPFQAFVLRRCMDRFSFLRPGHTGRRGTWHRQAGEACEAPQLETRKMEELYGKWPSLMGKLTI